MIVEFKIELYKHYIKIYPIELNNSSFGKFHNVKIYL